jgi:hypothetical protein
MLDSTKDIFYLVLSFCVLWFTVFLCWGLYYFVKILRQTNDMMEHVRNGFSKATSLFSFAKNKLVSESVKGIMSLINKKVGKKKK